MITGCVIRKNEYHDSVFLMRVAKRLSEQEGILQAAVSELGQALGASEATIEFGMENVRE